MFFWCTQFTTEDCSQYYSVTLKECPSGKFSSKSFYAASNAHPVVMLSCLKVVLGLAPKVEAFYWSAIDSKVSIADIFIRKGIVSESISEMCSSCKEGRESINLSLHCDTTPFLLESFFKRLACNGACWDL